MRSYSAEKQAPIVARYRQLYNEDIGELSRAEVLAKYATFREQLREVRKHYREKVAFRLRLSLKGVAYATPVVSVIVTLGGYFYTHRVYSHFDIVASNFFTVGDYLSAGIHAVDDAALYAALFVVFMVWRVVDYANLTRYERTRNAFHEKWQGRLIASSCVGGLVISLVAADDDVKASGWFAVILYILGLRIADFLLDRIFRPSISLMSIVFSTVVFAALLYVDSNRTIIEIERNDGLQDFRLLLEDSEFTSDQHSIIGSGGGYLFLWQRDDKEVEVVPHTKIRRMSLFEKSE